MRKVTEFSQAAEMKAGLRKEEHTTAKAKGQRKQAEDQAQVSAKKIQKSKFQLLEISDKNP